MKKLLSVVACCGSRDMAVLEEGRSLVVQPRRGRKRGRVVAMRGGVNVNYVSDWTPSLSSISEDDVFPEKDQRKQQENSCKESKLIKRKTESSSVPRTNHYNPYYSQDVRRTSFSAMFPALSPTPFMF
ncbi:hypothetical protein LIER_25953 [Lithospermum erythrorhizon]|uniref:Uncharacterized protein n=1 Tax=Lithospermum erythrorhizon TaxID=34254 RepID=A0AAV3RAN6_LITER